MSGPHDTMPPASAPPTSPALGEVVIERGHAQEAVLLAIDNVVQAIDALECVAMACARQLDATATEGT